MELEKYWHIIIETVEMQGYISQMIYVRTGNDEDFRIKLMMKGKTEFYSFQPKFWAILKSLNFGSKFFSCFMPFSEQIR